MYNLSNLGQGQSFIKGQQVFVCLYEKSKILVFKNIVQRESKRWEVAWISPDVPVTGSGPQV